ncbi:hypothetical protein D3C73_910230 [compost metagenome]
MDPGHQVDVEFFHDSDDGTREALPLQVGLEAGKQQERLAETVVQLVQPELWRLVVLQMVLHKADVGPPGTVVDELVGIEHGHHFGAQFVQQFRVDLPDHVTGIGKARESHDHVQPAKLGAVEGLDVSRVQRFGVQEGAGYPFKHGVFLSQ